MLDSIYHMTLNYLKCIFELKWTSFSNVTKSVNGFSILLHDGVISLKDATSCDKLAIKSFLIEWLNTVINRF